jgi:hypothetical protein
MRPLPWASPLAARPSALPVSGRSLNCTRRAEHEPSTSARPVCHRLTLREDGFSPSDKGGPQAHRAATPLHTVRPGCVTRAPRRLVSIAEHTPTPASLAWPGGGSINHQRPARMASAGRYPSARKRRQSRATGCGAGFSERRRPQWVARGVAAAPPDAWSARIDALPGVVHSLSVDAAASPGVPSR